MNSTQRRRGVKAARAFTMIETMIASVVAMVGIVGSLGIYSAGLARASAAKFEYTAFTIAQQKMELIAALPQFSPILSSSVDGDPLDPDPTTGVDGPATSERTVNDLGQVDPFGKFTVYWKVEPTTGSAMQIVVYCRYGTGANAVTTSLQMLR